MVQARTHAEEVEQALNLKRQLRVLDSIADSDMIFQDTSPPRRWDTVYSMQTGEPIRVPRHRLVETLQKRLSDGSAAFTADKDRAPEYRLGVVKCFLSRGSKEREEIDELNLAPGYYCIAEHLANPMAAQVHAEKRHPTRWRMYKEHLAEQQRQEDRQRQDSQIAAIMELARSKGGDGELEERRGPGRPRKEG